MVDREKVITGLHCCSHIDGTNCIYCPYDNRDTDCAALMSMDVLELLKEQEAVAVHDPGAYCPKCGWMLYPEDHPHHCGNCGQAVKWDD